MTACHVIAQRMGKPGLISELALREEIQRQKRLFRRRVPKV